MYRSPVTSLWPSLLFNGLSFGIEIIGKLPTQKKFIGLEPSLDCMLRGSLKRESRNSTQVNKIKHGGETFVPHQHEQEPQSSTITQAICGHGWVRMVASKEEKAGEARAQT